MRKIAFAAILFASNGLCQTPAKEPDPLQALLVEVHQLRQDIEAMTVASQRVQIALYALQIQDTAVTRAAQRFDAPRDRRSGAEENRARTKSEIQRLETGLASGAPGLDQKQKEELQAALTEMKSRVDSETAEVQTRQTAEDEASTQLKNEQAKLGELQDRIERFDKILEKLGAGK